MLPKKIRICEVGLRDGLQNEKRMFTTEEKLELLDGMGKAGFSVIEVGSFMSPKAVPQMANTDEVFLCQVGTKKFLRFYKPFIGGRPPVNGL